MNPFDPFDDQTAMSRPANPFDQFDDLPEESPSAPMPDGLGVTLAPKPKAQDNWLTEIAYPELEKQRRDDKAIEFGKLRTSLTENLGKEQAALAPLMEGFEARSSDDPLRKVREQRIAEYQNRLMRLDRGERVEPYIPTPFDNLVTGLQDPQQYVEVAKGVPSGGVTMVGSSIQGAAGVQSSVSHGYLKSLHDRLANMASIDQGGFPGRLRDRSDSALTYYLTSPPEQRQEQRAALEQEIAQYKPTPVEERTLYKAGQSVVDFGKTLLPAAPGYEQAFGRQVGEGLGTMGMGLATGLAGRIPAILSLSTAGSGEALQNAIAFDKKERAAGRPGITEEEKATAALWGIGPGATDLLPIEVMLSKLHVPAAQRAALSKAVGRIGGQAMIEGAQEGGQQFLQNLIAQEVYNPNQNLGEGILSNAGIGGAVGGLAQTGAEAGKYGLKLMGKRSGRAGQPIEQVPDGAALPGAPSVESNAAAKGDMLAPEGARLPGEETPQPTPQPAPPSSEPQNSAVAPESAAQAAAGPDQASAAPEALVAPTEASRESLQQDFSNYLAQEEQISTIPDDHTPPPELINNFIDAEESLVEKFKAAGVPGAPRQIETIDDVKWAFEQATPEELAQYWTPKAVEPAPAVGNEIVTVSSADNQAVAEAKQPPEQTASQAVGIIASRVDDILHERLPEAIVASPEFAAIASGVESVITKIAASPTDAKRIVARELPKLAKSLGLEKEARAAIGKLLRGADPAMGELLSEVAAIAERPERLVERLAEVTPEEVVSAVEQVEAAVDSVGIPQDGTPYSPDKGATDRATGQALAELIDGKTPASQWQAALGIDEETYQALIAEAVAKGWLRRDASGKVRRAPKTARTDNIAAMVVGDAAPDTLPNIGPVVKTKAAERRWDAAKAAVLKAAAKILPKSVAIDFRDNIEIMRLKKEDELLALRRLQTNPGNSDMLGSEQEGVSDDRFVEDSPTAGREGIEAGAGQPAQSNVAGLRQGDATSRSGNTNAGSSLRAIQRIIRQESARFDDDGNVIVGRRSTEAKISARSGKGGDQLRPTQRIGTTEKFEPFGYEGSVEAVKLEEFDAKEGNLARLIYQVHSDGELASKAEITQRHDGAWEIEFVISHERRKGLGTKLYDAIEKDLGIKVSPSGILSDEGLAFWQKRSPASVQWHIPSPSWPEMHFSPAKLESEVSRTSREIRNLALKVGKARTMPADLHAELLEGYRKERRKLIEAWKSLPEEARAAKDFMFALRAFHGSPHDFDRFNVSKIGTGEGAQSYGYGLYFAESAVVANRYQVGLTIKQTTINGRQVELNDEMRVFLEAKLYGETQYGQTIDDLVTGGEEVLSRLRSLPKASKSYAQKLGMSLEELRAKYERNIAAAESYLAKAKEVQSGDIKTAGHFYEVSIDVEPEQLLDWDAPLFEQDEKVKTLIANFAAEHLPDGKDEKVLSWLDPEGSFMSASGFYQNLSDDFGQKSLSQMLYNSGILGIIYLDQGSRSAGEGTRNIVVFDDSLVKITHKNGEPVTEKERASVTEQMHQEQDGRDKMLALRGFFSPAIRAAESLNQQKGTGEQFWKQITKVPGVRKDELDWIGLEEFLKGKKSITKTEVVEFMKAHQIELDDIILGSGDISKGGGARYSAFKVTGGKNYRELLIRHPDLGPGRESSEWKRLEAERERLFFDEENSGGESLPKIAQLRARQRELEDWRGYYSVHFGDQEIVHLRVDDRIGPNGEKTLFINEVQSDLHQAGRKKGYIRDIDRKTKYKASTALEKVRFANPNIEIRDPQIYHALDKRFSLKRFGGEEDSLFYPIMDKIINSLSDEDVKAIDSARSIETKVPNAPFKGDLWVELALKRALLYAVENGYDSVSWATSDQVARAVRTAPSNLAMLYDKKIGDFIAQYTKKWGGKIEEASGIVQERSDLIIAPNFRDVIDKYGDGDLDFAVMKLNNLEYRNEITTEEAEVLSQLIHLQQIASQTFLPAVNPILRITPQMRASVLEGQPLALRGKQSNNAMGRQPEPQALGRTDPYNLIISLAMEAIEAEAKAKSVSTEKEAVRVARHEFVEFFKASGMFADQEWALLERTARKNGWVETTGVRNAYTALYGEAFGEKNDDALEQLLIKEAIAEQYGEFESGKKFAPAIAAIFQRIKAFLTRVMNSLRGMGFQTWEDVFTRIDSGEFAKRFDKVFEVEQQRAGADIAPMALPGTKSSLPLSPGAPEAVAMGDSEPTLMSLVDIQRRLRKRLGLTVGRGRLDPETAKNAAMAGGKLMGQYNRKTDVIRLRTLEDIESETHEIAHALESRYDLDGLKQAHSAELDGVAAAVGQSGLSEGFAEFLRLYMTNPDAASAHTPLFFDAFEEHFDAVDQDLLQNLQEARDQYGVWRNAPSASRLQAAIKSGVKETYFEKLKKSTDKFTEVAGGFFNYLGDIYTNRWDDTNPFRRIALHIADIAEEKGQKIDLGAWKNPKNLAQKIRMADSAGYMDITKGVGWDGRSGHGEISLVSALSVAFSGQEYDQWAAEQRDAFGAYLIARRGRWLWMRHDMPMDRSLGRLANAPENAQHGDWYYDTMRRQRRVFLHNRWESELLHSPDKHASADFHQTIADHDAKNPQFEKAAQMVYAFLRDLALKRHQAGLDSTEEYEHKVGSADYVPWFRDMSDEMFQGSAGSGRKVAAKYKLKGSYRDFINPVEGIIRQVFDTSREVAVNKSKLALAELAEAVTGAGRYAEIIPATRMKVEEIRVRELLENTFRQQGIPPEDAKQMISTIAGMIGEDVVAKLYSQTQASEKGDAILHYMDGGELKMLQIHDDGRQTAKEILAFYEIAKGTPLPDHLMGMLSAAIRVPQKAITSAVGFQWKNIIRDMKNMTVLVRGYAPLVSNIQTVRENRARSKAGDETYGDLIARHGGIMGGIGMTDTQMMRSGRILGMSELVNSKRTWLNYLNLSHENFWKWTEWSEANARQTVMRLSYKRALADAKHSYPNMPLAKQEFIALEAAAQKSRDYINYASIGAAKSQPTLNRTFMFLNPFLQGWSKIVRAAFFAETDEGRFAAASVIRKKLMPLFNEEYKKKTLTDKEVAALKDAFRMWAMVGIIACTHLLIELIFNTPEELKDKDELDRSMNVVMTIGGEPWRIPRGFDIVNIVSNLVRGTYDSWIKEDPTAWKRFREAALMSIMPPSSNPIIDALIGYKHGRSNFMNRELEPDHLQGKLPGERVHSGTSMLAKDVSSAIKTISSKEFSPIMIDFSINLMGAEWARDFARAYDLARPGAPALKWQQYPFVRSARGLSGSRGQTEFWGLMGKEGAFTMPARSYKSEAVVHQNWSKEEVRKFFDTRVKDDDAKAYAILISHYDKDQQRLHPMARADEFISAISKTISEARLDRVDMKTAEKKAGRKVKERADLTPEERTAAIDILAEIRRREYVNALIALRRPGYEKDEPQPTKEFIEELKKTAPEIWKSLSDKLIGKGSKPHIYDFEAVRNGWPAMRRTLLERNKINEIVEERGQVLFRDLKGEAAIARASGLR